PNLRLQHRHSSRTSIEAVQRLEVLTTGGNELLPTSDRQLLQRLQAVCGKARSGNRQPSGPPLSLIRQHHIGCWPKPFCAAEAGLKCRAKTEVWASHRRLQQPRCLLAMAVIRVAQM